MLTTEKMAKEKLCVIPPALPRGDGSGTDLVSCVASDCMAWRWNDEPTANEDNRRGFCGLAGRPAVEFDPMEAMKRGKEMFEKLMSEVNGVTQGSSPAPDSVTPPAEPSGMVTPHLGGEGAR